MKRNEFLLSKEYVALALIQAKTLIFSENFATTSELNQFTIFMQREFNKQKLCISFAYSRDLEDFNIKGGIVTAKEKCYYSLNDISDTIKNILTDKKLLLNFFMEVEKKRLERIENFQTKISIFQTKENILSPVSKISD